MKPKGKCPACGEVAVIPGLMLCRACKGFGKDSADYRAWVTPDTEELSPVSNVTNEEITPVTTVTNDTPPIITPGEVCPTCDERKPSVAALKQRAWRKKNANED